MKGVNKGHLKNPMPYYKHVLTMKQNFRASNQGVCTKDESMVTYKQYKECSDLVVPEMKSTS